jgi:hypothetical protein
MSTPAKEENILARVGVPSLVLNVIAVISALAQLLEPIHKAVPTTAVFAWFSLLAIVSAIFVWALATAPTTSLVMNKPRPRYPFRYSALTAACIATASCVAGAILSHHVYPKIELKNVEQPSNWKSPDPEHAMTLWDLFKAANPELIAAASSTKSTHVTFVMGGAGEGKSFVRDRLIESFPNALVRRLCKREGGFCKNTEWGTYTRKPELTYGLKGEFAFNWMSAIQRETFNGAQFFGDFDKHSLVIIDDLDEIHPESVKWFLDVLTEFASNLRSDTQILVLGRPEAFAAFYRETNAENRTTLSPFVVLAAPSYKTEREVIILAEDWAGYMLKTQRVKVENPDAIGKRLFKYTQNWPWIFQTIHELYLANFLCESIWHKPEWKEAELKKQVVSEVYDRAHTTHDRPALAKGLYENLILDISASAAARVDAKTGYFPVQNWSMAVSEHDATKGDVRVQQVLALSGLARMYPANWLSEQWRFEPAWLHEFFVDEYNKRRQPAYWVVGKLFWVSLELLPLVALVFGYRRRQQIFREN